MICIAPNTWNRHWELYQHLSLALARETPVLYAQEPQPWHKGWRCRDESYVFAKHEELADGLSLVRLPKILARRGANGNWNEITDGLKGRLIRRSLASKDSPRVLYLWHPHLVGYADVLKPDILVYHVFDITPPDEAIRGPAASPAFMEICERADLVITGTSEQAEYIPRDDIMVVPNAVPYDWYCSQDPEPVDLALIPHPRVGFVGSITDRLDFETLERLSTVAEWNLVLIGPEYSLSKSTQTRLDRLAALPNVWRLGCKNATEVPQYLKHLDLGLMPYRRDGHCDIASPIKLYEYAAAGLPIVGTPLKSLGAVDGGVFVETAATANETVAKVTWRLANPLNERERTERQKCAERNSWDTRAVQILHAVQEKLNAKQISDSRKQVCAVS